MSLSLKKVTIVVLFSFLFVAINTYARPIPENKKN